MGIFTEITVYLNLTVPPLRSVIFFFMLIMLGMDSAMGGLECVITGIMDEYQGFFQKRRISRSHHISALRIQEYTIPTKIFREVFTGFIVFSSYAVAITCVTPVKRNKKQNQNQRNLNKGRFLHLQPVGNVRSRPLPPRHSLRRGHRSQLVLWTQVGIANALCVVPCQ